MSRLEKLIAEHCPNGVEYKFLKECCILSRGDYITKKSAKSGKIPVILGGQEPAYYIDKANHYGKAIVISRSGVSAGFVSYWDEPIFVTDGFIIEAKQNLSMRFLYYYLKNLQSFLNSMKKGGGVPHITGENLLAVRIPIPPLSIQSEIVRILDRFTERTAQLTEQLTAELTARKFQYKYYCKKILMEGKNTVSTPIEELGKWTGGCTPSMAETAYWENGTIPWISSKDMKTATLLDTQDHITEKALEETPIKMLPADTVAIVARSGILKHTLPVAYIPFTATVNQDIKALVTDKSILPRYAYFAIFAFSDDILKKTKKQGGTVDSLDVKAFMRYEIPVPAMEEQQRIVAMLNRFDALCNDLSGGLPAEIEARQKQYEYYRDKLLSFKELTT